MNHIAFVIPGLARIGGAERQLLLLSTGMRQRGWQVSVIALGGISSYAAATLHSADVDTVSLKMRKGLADPRGWLHLHRWIKAQQPDIVHAHLPHAAWISRWSRLRVPVRVVIDTVHTTATGSWSRRVGFRASHWLTNTVTFVSTDALSTWMDCGAVPPNRTAVIQNAVDTDLFLPDAEMRATMRARLDLDREFLWFTAGRFQFVKNYPLLLTAMRSLPSQTHLLIAGTGPDRAEQKRMTRALGLENRVRFIGFVHDVHRWMQAADAVVLASRWEGLPSVLLEAGACALPSVATNVPGTRQVLRHGQTGLLVPSDDPIALASAMSDLMRMPPEMRHQLGSNARHHIIKSFSLNGILDRWHHLYSRLLAECPTPRRWSTTPNFIPDAFQRERTDDAANVVQES